MKTEKTGVFNYPGTVRKINTIQSIRLLNTFRKNPITTMDDLFRNQGDFVELSVGPKKIVICSHPQLAEEVLRQKAPNYRKSRLVFDQIIPLTGRTGLVQMEGELGRTHREYTGPGLNYEAISAAYPLMVQSISGGLEKISAEGIHGKKIDLSTYLTEIILRNALILILGQEDDTERLGKAFLEANRICGARIRGLVPFSAYWPSSKNRELKKCIRSIDEAIFSLIEKRIKNSANQGPDLLSVLIRSNFAKSQIRDHVVTFLFAGYETTASSLVWTLSLLSRNRQVEARIRDECGQIISGGSPTLPDLRKLSYTLNVYQESLRLFPPSWTLAREVTTETQLGGHILKKGTIVLLGVGQIQKHPVFWDDGNTFNPDRFGNGWPKHPYSFIPFGGGSRICIGKNTALIEATLFLALAVPKFKFHLSPEFVPEVEALITAHPKNGLPVQVEPLSEGVR